MTTTQVSVQGLDAIVRLVKSNADAFALMDCKEKSLLLNECASLIVTHASTWTDAACAAKRLDPASNAASEEWLGGPVVAVRYARLLAASLMAVYKNDCPVLECSVLDYDDDSLGIGVFPFGLHDSLALSGYSASVRFPRGVSERDIIGSYASENRKSGMNRRRELCLVLGAGNVASIPFADVFSKMFIEGYVVVLKLNPVNEWVGPAMGAMLKPLLDRGFLRIVTGGGDVGEFLCEHPDVDAIHVTGAGATHDRIVWGSTEEERKRRMLANDPRIGSKKITSELGNVSPVLVVPGEYTTKELYSMVMNIVSMKTNNAGFNCNSAQVVVTAEGWHQRKEFLNLLCYFLLKTPARYAYYPGAQDRYNDLLSGVNWRGVGGGIFGDYRINEGYLPWAFVNSLDSRDHKEKFFTTEVFGPILTETAIPTDNPWTFLKDATSFANARLPGTLNATLMVPPSLYKDLDLAAEMERSIDRLRYGTVGVNVWPGVGFGLGVTPWGAAPGGTLKNPESGIGWVHNSLMLEGMNKVILRGPLVGSPKPPWFADNRNSLAVAKKLLKFEHKPSLLKLPGLAMQALKG